MAIFVKIDSIKLNPENPRTITDERFDKLVHSVANFPKMLPIRGVVVDADGMCLGGNQRWTAICSVLTMDEEKLSGIVKSEEILAMWMALRAKKHVPKEWIVSGASMTPEEMRQFIVMDNVPFGKDDIQQLMHSFKQEELSDWGAEIVLPKMPEFSPNINPTSSFKEVQDGDIENASDKMQANLDARPDLITLTCPHCFEGFQIQKPS